MNRLIASVLAFLLLGAGGVALWQWFQPEEETKVKKEVHPERRLLSETPNEKIRLPLVGLTDPSLTWAVRTEELTKVEPESLSEKEIDHLYQLIGFQPEASHASDWYVVLNELLNYLCHHNIDRQRITPAFTQIISDPDYSLIARDYAIQALGTWLRPGLGSGRDLAETDPEAANLIFDTFFSVLRDPQNRGDTLPGTTLNILSDFLPRAKAVAPVDLLKLDLYPGADLPAEALSQASRKPRNPAEKYPLAQELEDWLASAIPGKNLASIATRVTAIQVAARARFEKFLPEIRQIAFDSPKSDTLKLSAISAIGILGEEGDRHQLQDIAISQSKFRYAAQASLKQLTVNR